MGAPQIGVGLWRSQGCELQGALGSLGIPGVVVTGDPRGGGFGVLESLVVLGAVALEVPGVVSQVVPTDLEAVGGGEQVVKEQHVAVD